MCLMSARVESKKGKRSSVNELTKRKGKRKTLVKIHEKSLLFPPLTICLFVYQEIKSFTFVILEHAFED